MTILNTFQVVGEYVGILIVGVFGGMYLFSKSLKLRRKETDESDTRLVSLLKDTVDELERKVDNLTAQQKTNVEEIQELKNANEIMTKIFQGRDGKSDEMYTMIKATMENTNKLFELMKQHMNLTEKIVGKMPQQ